MTARAKKLAIVGAGSFAAVAAAMTLGLGTANADVEEIAPSNQPEVTSRQATVVSEDGVRLADIGAARGLQESRNAEKGIVSAQSTGDDAGVRDSVKAVTGDSTASPFPGEFTPPGEGPLTGGGPALGDW